MRRCESALKQEPHRVTFVSHSGLDSNKDIAKGLTQDKELTTISPMLSGRRSPLRFDFLKIRFSRNVIVNANGSKDVGLCPVLLRIPLQQGVPQGIDILGHIYLITRLGERVQRIEQRLKDVQMRSGTRGATALYDVAARVL